jgi:phosphoribosyl 1,2-cyclic phosphodiesterase
MVLKVIGSNSRGNSYILENNNEALLLECGVKFKKVKEAICFDISKIVAAVITHEHIDHAGYVKEVAEAGIPVYTSKGTASKIHEHFSIKAIGPEESIKVGSFKILPFPVTHDAAEPFGFLINHPETGIILFATDTCEIPYAFPDLNQILVEVNYQQEIIDNNILNGRIPWMVRKRVLESHMELGTFISFLKETDITNVQNIVLLHLSDGNSHARKMKEEVIKHTGKQVHVADQDMIIDLNQTPF